MGVQPQSGSNGDTITVTHSEGWWVARDEETGVASQGETKTEALANLAEALELHLREDSDAPEPEPSNAPWFQPDS